MTTEQIDRALNLVEMYGAYGLVVATIVIIITLGFIAWVWTQLLRDSSESRERRKGRWKL